MIEFQAIIGRIITFFQELIAVEQMKLNAASDKHIACIEECMKKEQVLTLKLKGLEKERQELQEKAGWGGLTFHEILEQASESERQELFPLFDSLSREIQMYQEVSGDATTIIEINARKVEQALQAKAEEGQVYADGGKNISGEKHFTSRRI